MRVNTSDKLASLVHNAHNLKGLVQGHNVAFSATSADLSIDVRNLEVQTHRVGEVVVVIASVGQGEVQHLLLLLVLLVDADLLRAPEGLADLNSK